MYHYDGDGDDDEDNDDDDNDDDDGAIADADGVARRVFRRVPRMSPAKNIKHNVFVSAF